VGVTDLKALRPRENGDIVKFMTVLLLGVARVVTVQVKTCCVRGQVFQKQPKLGSRKQSVVGSRVCQRRDRTAKLIQNRL